MPHPPATPIGYTSLLPHYVAFPTARIALSSDEPVLVGHRVSLTCQSTGSGQLTITWYKDGKVDFPEGITMTAQGILTIQSASSLHTGVYRCVVSSLAGQANDSISIAVKGECVWHSEYVPHTA